MAEMPTTYPSVTSRDSATYVCEYCPGTQIYLQGGVPWIITPDTPPMSMSDYMAALVDMGDGRKQHPAHEGRF